VAISGLLEETLGVIDYPIRIVEIDGEPWFVAADVCRALGLNGYASWNLGKLAPEEKRVVRRSVSEEPILRDAFAPHQPSMTLISESGLYKLTMRSDKPQARQFQDWVTRVVLPSIRKHGGYVAGQEKTNGLASFWAPSAH
jgi:prophage antirepressor-like protein